MPVRRPIRLKRVYEAPAATDGCRVLVDRLWPRGLARSRAALDAWCKEIAPSNALRRWFGHDRERWSGFVKAYRAELAEADSETIAWLRREADSRGLTLLFAARDTEYNHAVVLRNWIEAENGS